METINNNVSIQSRIIERAEHAKKLVEWDRQIQSRNNLLTAKPKCLVRQNKTIDMIIGYYYLHENKELIYKNSPDAITDIRESDLCHSAWAMDRHRATAWQILVEALSLGARISRIDELAEKWGCDDKDAHNYAEYLGIDLDLDVDGDQKTAKRKDFVDLQSSPCGFGDTYLEAMADLCEKLGFKGGKMWNTTFKDLVK